MEILNGSNTSENSGEELDESGFTISSDGMDMKSMAEKLQKMETELLSMKRVNGRLETALLVMKKGNGQQQQTTTTGEPSLIQMGWQMAEKFNKMETEMTKMANKMTELEDKNRNLENEMGKIQEKNGKLEEKIGGMKEEINKLKEDNIALSLKNRLNVDEPSVEITNLHDCMGDENVHSRIESMENELKSVKKQISLNQLDAKKNINKLDWRDCGTAMNVLEGIGMALSLNYSGNVHKWNTVRAESAIQSNIKWEMLKKDSISVVNYFEMKIEKKPNGYGIRMGYADLEFPLEGVGLGDGNAGSIGVYGRGGICIGGMAPLHFETNNSTARKKSYFREGDMAGCGLLYSAASQTLECFAACNGKLLGSFELPHKFIGLQLFPAISLCYPGQSIRANFGQDPFCYDPNQLARG